MNNRLWDVVLVPDVFTAHECAEILQRMEGEPLDPATVLDNDHPTLDRVSNTRFVEYDPDVWVFQRLNEVIRIVNPKTFRFDLNDKLDEGFQFTQYPVGGYYGWHSDIGAGKSELRKLSVVVMLDTGYEGGELQFFPAKFVIPKQAGMAVIFPSYMPHCVRTVTSGTRHSLVTWVAGPDPFK